MLSFNLPLPGLSSVTNSVGGIFPTKIFNQNPIEDSQTPGLLSQGTGLLSHTSGLLSGVLDWPTPNPPIVWDASCKQLCFAFVLRFLSFVRGFIPPFILSLMLLCIPTFIYFYELTFRRFLPQLPSIFTISFKLYKNGVLTIGTVTWLLSRLPQSTIGGLSAVGGLAMGGTAALAGGATALADGATALADGATALAGGATALVGGATASAGAIVGGVAGLATNGLGGAANVVGGATESIADGLAHIQMGELEIAHLLSGEQGAAASAVQSLTHPVAAIGAAQTAVTGGATQLAHALGSVNPLRMASRAS